MEFSITEKNYIQKSEARDNIELVLSLPSNIDYLQEEEKMVVGGTKRFFDSENNLDNEELHSFINKTLKERIERRKLKDQPDSKSSEDYVYEKDAGPEAAENSGFEVEKV